jgi:hypothetical protein
MRRRAALRHRIAVLVVVILLLLLLLPPWPAATSRGVRDISSRLRLSCDAISAGGGGGGSWVKGLLWW